VGTTLVMLLFCSACREKLRVKQELSHRKRCVCCKCTCTCWARHGQGASPHGHNMLPHTAASRHADGQCQMLQHISRGLNDWNHHQTAAPGLDSNGPAFRRVATGSAAWEGGTAAAAGSSPPPTHCKAHTATAVYVTSRRPEAWCGCPQNRGESCTWST
jgi:hypothetical protein